MLLSLNHVKNSCKQPYSSVLNSDSKLDWFKIGCNVFYVNSNRTIYDTKFSSVGVSSDINTLTKAKPSTVEQRVILYSGIFSKINNTL